MSELILRVENERYAGWKRVSITRSIDRLAGTFELTLTDRWAIEKSAARILDGQSCQVIIGGSPVITGWIDDVSTRHGPDQHELTVRGRDAAGDLVDCAAITGSQEIVGRTLAQVARAVCAPFGIGITVEADVGGPFRYTHVQPGETCYELLDRLARLRGVLVISDGNGGIILTRAGAQRANTGLTLGTNIMGGAATRSQRDRYSRYRVVGQQRASDNLVDESAAQSVAEVTDPQITRYRPIVIQAEDQADISTCQTRARWERSVRAGQGNTASVDVRGWRDGVRPWQPNTQVLADDEWLGLNGDYLVVSVSHSLDGDDGEVTQLKLEPPAARQVLPEKETNPNAESALFSPSIFGSALPDGALES